MAKVLALSDWIHSQGGVPAVAKLLGVERGAPYEWLYRRCWPRIDTMLKLVALSDGALTMESIIRDTYPPKHHKLVRRALGGGK